MAEKSKDRIETPARRRTRARLKELLLQAAEEVLDRDGLGFNTDTVTYKTVFAHLEESQGIRVTRGSVHERIWNSQRDFQIEVLRRALEWNPEASTDALVATAMRVLEDADLSDIDGRWEAARNLVRACAREVYVTSDVDDHWPQWIGLTLALASHPDSQGSESRLMLDGARDSYRERTGQLAEIYRGFIAATHMRLRQDLFPDPEAALLLMTRSVTALADGMALREQFDPAAVEEVQLNSRKGTTEPWHPFSLSAWAVVRFFLEPIPQDEA